MQTLQMFAGWMALGAATTAHAQAPFFQQPLNADDAATFVGMVDLHTHPMAHLGFGGKLIHGAPAPGVLMPQDMAACGITHRPFNIVDAMPHCLTTHGPWDLAVNPCGNMLRTAVVAGAELGQGAALFHGPPTGAPTFIGWPHHDNLTHQMMWVDWIERAHRGGLRVLVALAVNNVTLASAIDGNQPYDDVHNIQVQFDEMRAMASRHSFMEIAESPHDLRRILQADRLAVVLGVEVDNIGNLEEADLNDVNHDFVRQQIQDIHALGARYAFPVHMVDNAFGGAAVYEALGNVSNFERTGHWWNIECSPLGSDITEKVVEGDLWEVLQWLLPVLGTPGPDVPDCVTGHQNHLGLTRLGRVALEEMMDLGMMIDIDHMSTRTVGSVFEVADDWSHPLNSGHTNRRKPLAEGGGSENNRTDDEYRKIHALGGMVGVGSSKRTADQWLERLQEIQVAEPDIGLALGTDANGLVIPAKPSGNTVSYPMSRDPLAHSFTTGTRHWTYATDGVANYGMLPDYVRDVEEHFGGHGEVGRLFEGAQRFLEMWEASEASTAPPPPPLPQPEVPPGQPAPTVTLHQAFPLVNHVERCPSVVLAGDREFDGNGPQITAHIQLSVSPDRSRVEAEIRMHAVELGGDGSETDETWTETLWEADPADEIVDLYDAEMRCDMDAESPAGGAQLFHGSSSQNHKTPMHCGLGVPVKKVRLVGDTGGDDISTDTDCNDDARIEIWFDEFEVATVPR